MTVAISALVSGELLQRVAPLPELMASAFLAAFLPFLSGTFGFFALASAASAATRWSLVQKPSLGLKNW